MLHDCGNTGGQTAAANIASPISFAGGTVSMGINNSTGFTFSGDITETTATNLSKTGGGTLVLAGQHGYTGTTSVRRRSSEASRPRKWPTCCARSPWRPIVAASRSG